MAQATKTRKSVGWAAVRRARRWTQEQGEWVISEWQRSGESVQRFASQHGLDPQRIYLWRRRARPELRSRSIGPVRPEVVEVKLAQPAFPAESRIVVELLSGRRLSVAEYIDVDVLERVVAALER